MKCFFPRDNSVPKNQTNQIRMFNIASNNNNNKIDFDLLPKNCPSLCIPRVFGNITKSRICKIFLDISIGRIEEIEIIKGEKFNRVLIHLTWNTTPDAQFVRNQVMTGKDVKIIYDEPWYWLVSAFRKQPPPLSYKTDEYGREIRHTHRKQEQEQRRKQEQEQEQRRKQEQEPPLTDAFGRDVRRRPPPPSTRPPSESESNNITTTTITKKSLEYKKNKSWSSESESEDEDEDYNEKELHRIKRQFEVKSKFIPQSPTSTPPSLTHKQMKLEDVQQEQDDEEPVKKNDNKSKYDVDEPTSAPVKIVYNNILPINKIRSKK